MVRADPSDCGESYAHLKVMDRWNAPPSSEPVSPFRLFLLVAGLVFCIFRGWLLRPYNLFEGGDLRRGDYSALERLAASRTGNDDRRLQLLMGKLRSLDGRLAYIRLGATPLIDCTFCQSYTEQAVYALPPKLAAYACAAALIGLLSRYRWRSNIFSLLAISFAAESVISLVPNLFHSTMEAPLATYTHVCRHAVFAIAIVSAFVLTEKPSPMAHLAPALRELIASQERATFRLRAAQIQRTALMSEDRSRAQVVDHWRARADAARVARSDERIKQAVVRLDLQEGGTERRKLHHFVEATFNLPPPVSLPSQRAASQAR